MTTPPAGIADGVVHLLNFHAFIDTVTVSIISAKKKKPVDGN